MGIGAAWFGIRRRFFSIGAGGMLESSGGFDVEGEWTRLSKTWSEARLSDTLFAIVFLVRDLSRILVNLVLNLSTTFADAVTSFRNR